MGNKKSRLVFGGIAAIVIGAIVVLVFRGPVSDSKFPATRQNLGTRYLSLPSQYLVSPEQKELLKAVESKYRDRLDSLVKESRSVITREQTLLIRAGLKKLKESNGQTNLETINAIEKAAGVTPEQKRQKSKLQSDFANLIKEMQLEAMQILKKSK